MTRSIDDCFSHGKAGSGKKRNEKKSTKKRAENTYSICLVLDLHKLQRLLRVLVEGRMRVHPAFLRHTVPVFCFPPGLDLDQQRLYQQLFHLTRPRCAVGLCGVFFLALAGHYEFALIRHCDAMGRGSGGGGYEEDRDVR